MIPKECKRLAEVDFPISDVSRHAAREKSIRHGHPSTLHMWWARRPLASSRAVLMTLLLPDPCDEHCPEEFKKEARRIFLSVYPRPLGGMKTIESDAALRKIILEFIADFANWDRADDYTHLDVGRSLVKAAHGKEPPLVVDPFAGGGSIPLEALRLGCEAFASDLNPVACLILKVMLEDIPRHGPELAQELRKIGGELKRHTERELADLYPADPDGAQPTAYLWARTVRCEAPRCGAEIPLMRSFWLCRKSKRKWALRSCVELTSGSPPRVEFEVFAPKADKEVGAGTVTRARATCLCCGAVLPPGRVRAQLATQDGGANVVFDNEGRRTGGARMTAVVTIRPKQVGRHYRLPTNADYKAVWKAQKRLEGILDSWKHDTREGPCPTPDEPLPPIGTLGFRVQRYGMLRWGDLFAARPTVALAQMSAFVASLTNSRVTKSAVAMVVGRCAAYASSGVIWVQEGEFVANTFGRQALPIVWDFAEPVQVTDSSGNLEGAIGWVLRVIEAWPSSNAGLTQQADATDHPLPDESANIWFTDPPYYDAVPYADLSDFFLVWLKRALPDHPVLRDPFDSENPLSPKIGEAVQDNTKKAGGQTKDRAWFEGTMAKAFAEGRRILHTDGIGSVVFAHKTTEGWEALLSGLIQGGWTITGSWPIATERPGRLRSQDSAALATSVHLVCRPRAERAPIGDWTDVLRDLPTRVGDWMQRLQRENIRGADLVFACVGPALEVFSRYRAVETAEGRKVDLTEYLEKVWEVVGRSALEQVLGASESRARNRGGGGGGLEEDARLTALFLWTFQSTEAAGGDDRNEQQEEDAIANAAAKGFSLPYDVVRRFAQPMGIDLDAWTGRIIALDKGVVRLLPVVERAKDLFGEDGATAGADWIASAARSSAQATLFPEFEALPNSRSRRLRTKSILDGNAELQTVDATTLDRVHAAMMLQANGHTNALRMLIGNERGRGPEFLRLANSLSALYLRGSEEKRLLDAMLLAVPR